MGTELEIINTDYGMMINLWFVLLCLDYGHLGPLIY